MAEREDFKTPDRGQVSSELDAVARSLDMQRNVLDFDDYMEKIERENIAPQVAIVALNACQGNFEQAFANLHQGVEL